MIFQSIRSVRNQILLKIRTYAYNALLNKDESTERQAKIKYLPNVPCSIQQGNVYECKGLFVLFKLTNIK